VLFIEAYHIFIIYCSPFSKHKLYHRMQWWNTVTSPFIPCWYHYQWDFCFFSPNGFHIKWHFLNGHWPPEMYLASEMNSKYFQIVQPLMIPASWYFCWVFLHSAIASSPLHYYIRDAYKLNIVSSGYSPAMLKLR